ncbi:MFS transporter [Nocardiopsis sp. HNM0947]|uniref:MFS transporter n=1 Tax=Nocardiopsis coralli TaxID=2772213 RepID=A0ABR9P8T9_9ACTN|nr:MFS transporter [Nocardiopsis coralli]MBE3000264.1 MFS transporter [Nocardiopsis coralli]
MTTLSDDTARGPFSSAPFRRFFAARTMADLGTEVGALALPLLAVLTLDAGPGQVGLLGALSTAAYLVVGLPAGAWTDRVRRRPVIVLSQFLHGVVLLSIPLAWAAGVLTLAQLYVCAFLGGVAALFSRTAQQGFLPAVVGRERLMPANTALAGMGSAAVVAGRGVGGYLVQTLGAPHAVLLNGVVQCASAAVTTGVRVSEPDPERRSRSMSAEIAEGVRHVFGHSLLRPIAFSTLILNLGLSPLLVLAPVLIVGDLGLPESRVGLFFMVGAAGAVAGSLVAGALAAGIGTGRALIVATVLAGATAFAVPFLSESAFWPVCAVWALSQGGVGLLNVVQTTLRQRLTPDALLGRMTATMRLLMTGALTLGSLAAGVLAEAADVRTALAVGAAVMALAWMPLAFSPFRRRDPEVR